MARFKTKTTCPELITKYDGAKDALYLSVGYARPSEGKNRRSGIVVRYPLNDPKNAWGVIIPHFKASGWASNLAKLATVIAKILSVDREHAFIALRPYQTRNDDPASRAA
jgi:hypothetical protein